MASQATITSRNAQARHAKLQLSNMNGGIFTVLSVNTTTITLVSGALDNLINKTLYASGTPGLVMIVEGVLTADEGKTANITGITGDVLTVSVDCSTLLAAGDRVLVAPPMAVEVTTNGGHTLAVARPHDESMGLGESVLTHNTALNNDPSGGIPFFLARDSEALGRLLLAGIGSYKKSGTGATTIHHYVPPQLNDGTYTDYHDFAAYSQDGNGIIEQVWLGLMASQLDLNFPNVGVAGGSLQVMGTHVGREVGGTGKTFPSGSNNWLRTVPRDTGNRHVFSGVFCEFGGSFNAALTEGGHDRYILEANVQITRGLTDDTPLASPDRVVPVEDSFGIRVTGRRIAENDTIYQDFFGTSTSATPGQQAETRLLMKAVHPGDVTKTLTLDIPYGTWRVDDMQRQRGRYVESFTFVGKQKITSGAYDTANPLYRLQAVNGEDTDYGAAL